MIKRNNVTKSSMYHLVLKLSILRVILSILMVILAVLNMFLFKNMIISCCITSVCIIIILENIISIYNN